MDTYICHAHLECVRADRTSQIRPGRLRAHKQMSGAGRDVGEQPVKPRDAVGHQRAADCMVSEGDRHRLACVPKPDPRSSAI